MKKLLMVFIVTAGVNSASAQLYYYGIGVRAGKFNTGISFKGFFNPQNNTGVQLDLSYTNIASGGYTGRALFVKQVPFKLPIVQLPLDFIFGGGGHVGYFPFDPQGYYKRRHGDAVYYDKSVLSAGVDATIQIEYQVKKIAPFTLSIDMIPYFEFYNPGPEYIDFGVTVRYVVR